MAQQWKAWLVGTAEGQALIAAGGWSEDKSTQPSSHETSRDELEVTAPPAPASHELPEHFWDGDGTLSAIQPIEFEHGEAPIWKWPIALEGAAGETTVDCINALLDGALALPRWFDAVDQVTEMTAMHPVTVKPKPFATAGRRPKRRKAPTLHEAPLPEDFFSLSDLSDTDEDVPSCPPQSEETNLQCGRHASSVSRINDLKGLLQHRREGDGERSEAEKKLGELCGVFSPPHRPDVVEPVQPRSSGRPSSRPRGRSEMWDARPPAPWRGSEFISDVGPEPPRQPRQAPRSTVPSLRGGVRSRSLGRPGPSSRWGMAARGL